MKDPDKRWRLDNELISTPVANEEDETIWLLSYADLMTLLFTFFVMLYAAVQMNDGQALRNALAAYLQGKGDSVEEVKKALKQRLDEEKLVREIDMTMQKNGLNITFSSSLLFDLGSAELRADSRQTVEKMIALIKEKGPNLKIRVEGHTDDNPTRPDSHFKSNWELSGARAANLISLFEKQGFPPNHLIAIGYGASRPMQPNRTPSGDKDLEAQQKNRRVILTVYNEVPVEENNK